MALGSYTGEYLDALGPLGSVGAEGEDWSHPMLV